MGILCGVLTSADFREVLLPAQQQLSPTLQTAEPLLAANITLFSYPISKITPALISQVDTWAGVFKEDAEPDYYCSIVRHG